MIRQELKHLGFGFNKAKYSGKMESCIENGFD